MTVSHRGRRALCRGLGWLGRRALDPVDWERVGAPALADAELDAESGRAPFVRSLGAFVLASAMALGARRAGRVVERSWHGVVPVALATAVGVVVLRDGARPALAQAHLAFLVLGTILALAVGTCRATTLRQAAPWVGALVAAAWLGTATFGTASGGASRWVTAGPLVVHVSVLTWPLLVAAGAVSLARNAWRTGSLIVGLALAALALQGDASTAGVVTLALVGAALAARRPWVALGWLALGAVAVRGAGHVAVDLPAVLEAEGAWQLAVASSPALAALGLLASAAVAWAPRRALRGAPRIEARAFGVGAAVALAGFCARPLVVPGDAVFFLGTGGSPILGAMLAMAIAAAWAGEAAGAPKRLSAAAPRR